MKQILDNFVNKGIMDGVAPNISYYVYKNNKEYFGEFGKQDSIDGLLYDIASLTKVIVTILILKLDELKTLDINHYIVFYLNQFKNTSLTLKDLLFHHSGMNNFMVNNEHTKEDLLATIYQIECTQKELIYSDINFIILGEVLEQIGGFEKLLEEYLFYPLNMNETIFNPLKIFSQERIVKTETRSDRGEIWGEVHDYKSYFMQGVSGHAGIFSSIKDLAIFTKAILEKRIITSKTIQKFNQKLFGNNEVRTLGWLLKDSVDQMGLYTGKAIFHTGFTGCSILLSFETKEIGVLLTNRICPMRNNDKIFEFRKDFHNLIKTTR
ncbi:MAG: serine hydrolase domain-containing protein [Brevinema sp.]